MKTLQNIGLLLFFIGISLFTASIFTGSFNLSKTELDAYIQEKGYKSEVLATELQKAI